MTRILLKCQKHSNIGIGLGFPKVGEQINGIPYHGLLEGNGNWECLHGEEWAVVQIDEYYAFKNTPIPNLTYISHKGIWRFNSGTIVFRGTTEELSKSSFPISFELNENGALNWAEKIGNQDIMHKKIRSAENAYLWFKRFGTYKKEMIDIILNEKSILEFQMYKTSEVAFNWIKSIGDEDKLLPLLDIDHLKALKAIEV